MIPRGLLLGIIVGIAAGAIFGVIFVDFKQTELKFVEGTSLSIQTEKIDFKKGEEIKITIINSGTVPLTFSDASYGLKITALDGTIFYSPIAAQVLSILEPSEETTIVWDQIKNDGDQVLEGTYKITSSAIADDEKTIKKSITINILK